ncbi:MAG: DUF3501 family protein [Myxococcota bacterium]|nr:DUF3501 family protein [Myxococcota bacterium]
MKPVQRSEILDYVTYEEQRGGLRASALEAKRQRRITVGDLLCFLFENTETVRYQIQEMMRTEKIVKEAGIQHEIDTYNELIGGPGELRCTLLVGILSEADRERLLPAWLDLNEHLYLRLSDGRNLRPTWDSRQVGESRLSSVQYLSFAVGDSYPVGVGCDHPAPELHHETTLDSEQVEALREDLS